MIDSSTLNDLKEGSPAAFEKLFNLFHAKVYQFILSCVYNKSIAQDLTQSVFLTIWEHRKTIDPTKNINSYIYTISRNAVYRQTERLILHNKFQKSLMEEQNCDDNDIESNLDYQILERHIWELIEKLPSSRKEIFILSRKDGLSNRDIASRLSISEKTVETQITRSIRYIKKYVKPYISIIGLLIFEL